MVKIKLQDKFNLIVKEPVKDYKLGYDLFDWWL